MDKNPEGPAPTPSPVMVKTQANVNESRVPRALLKGLTVNVTPFRLELMSVPLPVPTLVSLELNVCVTTPASLLFAQNTRQIAENQRIFDLSMRFPNRFGAQGRQIDTSQASEVYSHHLEDVGTQLVAFSKNSGFLCLKMRCWFGLFHAMRLG